MAGIKISAFTETTDPQDFFVAGVQDGQNRKLNLGEALEATTSGSHYTFLPQSSAPTNEAGSVYYDDNLKSWVGIPNSNSRIELGRETWRRCYNDTGSTIAAGTPVYIGGAHAGFPSIAPAKANTKHTCTMILLATQSIPAGTYGECTRDGVVRGLNTSTFSVGQLVYVSATTAGLIVNTEPSYPNYSALIGRVLVSHTSLGEILFDPDTDPNVSSSGTPSYTTKESTFSASIYVGGKGTMNNGNGCQFGTSFYATSEWKPNKARIRISQGTLNGNFRVGLYSEYGLLLAQTVVMTSNGDAVLSTPFTAELAMDLVPGHLYHAVLCGKVNGVQVYGISPGNINSNPRMGFQGQISMNANSDCPMDITSIWSSSSPDRAWVEFHR